MTMSHYEVSSDGGSSHHHSHTKLHGMIADINAQVALFRDLLIHVGQPQDCPEMREKIRRVRRQCVDACKGMSQQLLPQIRSDMAEGIPTDNQHFVMLFFCTQMLLRELHKCRRLVTTLPLDMQTYYENRPGPSNLGGVLSQLLMCKQFTPDFNQEEVCSVDKDADDVCVLLAELQEFMPKQEENPGRNLALTGEDVFSKWARRRKRKTFYKNIGSFCCLCKSSYL